MQEKNKQIGLQFRKLLQEYNALLIALFTVPPGMMALTFNITKDIVSTFFIGGIVYLSLNSHKIDKSDELNDKVQEIQ